MSVLNVQLILQFAPLLLKGLAITCSLALLGNGVSLLLGGVIALMRMGWLLPGRTGSRLLQGIATAWVDAFRNIPLLIQVLFFYYVLDLPGYWAALLGLCTYTAAFMAETFRAGFATVPRQELEEAQLLGLTPWQVFTQVLLPRSLESNVSSLGSQVMNLTKNTSIAYYVAVGELTFLFESLSGQTYHFVEFFCVTLLAYGSLCWLVVMGTRRLEAHLLRRRRQLGVPVAVIQESPAEMKREVAYGT